MNSDLEGFRYWPNKATSLELNEPIVTGELCVYFDSIRYDMTSMIHTLGMRALLDQPGPIGRRLKAKRKGRRQQVKASQRRNRK